MDTSLKPLLITLRDARQQKGLTQRELGDKVGLPQSHVSRIESGAIDVQTSNLIELARALDLELALIPRQLLPTVAELKRQFASTAKSWTIRPEPARIQVTGQVPAFPLTDEDDDA